MDDLLNEIDLFRSTHGDMTEAKFGRLATNDTMLVKQLRDGREPRRRTIAAIRQFMATYRSPDAPERAQAA